MVSLGHNELIGSLQLSVLWINQECIIDEAFYTPGASSRSTAWINNYIAQYLCCVITYPCPRCLLSEVFHYTSESSSNKFFHILWEVFHYTSESSSNEFFIFFGRFFTTLLRAPQMSFSYSLGGFSLHFWELLKWVFHILWEVFHHTSESSSNEFFIFFGRFFTTLLRAPQMSIFVLSYLRRWKQHASSHNIFCVRN